MPKAETKSFHCDAVPEQLRWEPSLACGAFRVCKNMAGMFILRYHNKEGGEDLAACPATLAQLEEFHETLGRFIQMQKG